LGKSGIEGLGFTSVFLTGAKDLQEFQGFQEFQKFLCPYLGAYGPWDQPIEVLNFTRENDFPGVSGIIMSRISDIMTDQGSQNREVGIKNIWIP
jgi:hypothetical protein